MNAKIKVLDDVKNTSISWLLANAARKVNPERFMQCRQALVRCP